MKLLCQNCDKTLTGKQRNWCGSTCAKISWKEKRGSKDDPEVLKARDKNRKYINRARNNMVDFYYNKFQSSDKNGADFKTFRRNINGLIC